jgi:hypothetical protein
VIHKQPQCSAVISSANQIVVPFLHCNSFPKSLLFEIADSFQRLFCVTKRWHRNGNVRRKRASSDPDNNFFIKSMKQATCRVVSENELFRWPVRMTYWASWIIVEILLLIVFWNEVSPIECRFVTWLKESKFGITSREHRMNLSK